MNGVRGESGIGSISKLLARPRPLGSYRVSAIIAQRKGASEDPLRNKFNFLTINSWIFFKSITPIRVTVVNHRYEGP